ncbi:MAG: DUF5518 domain-containing protein [Haloplanus sp.]
MSRTGPSLSDWPPRWTYALLGGASSIPFTVAGYWQTGSELSLTAVLFGGALAGYLAARRTGTGRGVGVRAGVIGGLPVLVVVGGTVSDAAGLAGPSWFVVGGTVLAVGAAVAVAVVGIGLSALLGAVGARVGTWLAGTSGGARGTTTGR